MYFFEVCHEEVYLSYPLLELICPDGNRDNLVSCSLQVSWKTCTEIRLVRFIDLQTGKENPPAHHIEIGMVRVETCNEGSCNWSHFDKAFLPSEN